MGYQFPPRIRGKSSLGRRTGVIVFLLLMRDKPSKVRGPHLLSRRLDEPTGLNAHAPTRQASKVKVRCMTGQGARFRDTRYLEHKEERLGSRPRQTTDEEEQELEESRMDAKKRDGRERRKRVKMVEEEEEEKTRGGRFSHQVAIATLQATRTTLGRSSAK
eukprot:768515-Hanusia_phi.AAC.3